MIFWNHIVSLTEKTVLKKDFLNQDTSTKLVSVV